MRFVGVFPRDLACGHFWPQISSLLSESMPYGRGEYTLEDIRHGICAGELFAVGAASSGDVSFVAVCAIQEYPRKRVLYIQHGAGRNGSEVLHAVLSASKALGADWVETRCRPAVARLYRKLGFDTSYQVAILETPQ
jgi:hypothetical protein